MSPEADAGLIARRLRMAAAWAGPVTTGAYQAGDGTSSVTCELVGEQATVTLSLLVNAATGELPPGRRGAVSEARVPEAIPVPGPGLAAREGAWLAAPDLVAMAAALPLP